MGLRLRPGGCALSYKYRGGLIPYPRIHERLPAPRRVPYRKREHGRLSSLPLTIMLTFRRTILSFSFDPNENDSCPVFWCAPVQENSPDTAGCWYLYVSCGNTLLKRSPILFFKETFPILYRNTRYHFGWGKICVTDFDTRIQVYLHFF